MAITPKYSFFDQYFSNLGTGRYALIFNLSVITTSLLSASFYPISFYILEKQGYSKAISIIGIILGIFSFLFLAFVGIFNLDNNYKNIHEISAVLFIAFTGITQLMLVSGYSWVVCKKIGTLTIMSNKFSKLTVLLSLLFGLIVSFHLTFLQYAMQKFTIYAIIITTAYQELKIEQSDKFFLIDDSINQQCS